MSLELILKTPVEELVPKMIAFNNEELLAEVRRAISNYKGKVYDDTAIAEAKADRARLNNFVKQLNNRRLEIGKIYLAPYEKFKSQVDEVRREVDNAVGEIDVQIKQYEAKQKAQKRAKLIEYFKAKATEAGLENFVTFEQIESPQWLNATVKLEKAQAEINAKITQIQNELATIEALKSEDESTLKALYFRTLCLATALVEHEKLREERERIMEAKKRAEPPEATTPPLETPKKLFAVRFTVRGTKEQIIALRDFLNANNIIFNTEE
jgi:hypothetical protein